MPVRTVYGCRTTAHHDGDAYSLGDFFVRRPGAQRVGGVINDAAVTAHGNSNTQGNKLFRFNRERALSRRSFMQLG